MQHVQWIHKTAKANSIMYVAGFGFANGLFHFSPTQLVLAASRLYGPTDYHSTGYCSLYTDRLDTKNA